MNQFSKLSRDEMRKITGGEPPVCNVDQGCAGTFYINGHPHVLMGICREDIIGSCLCTREFDAIKSFMCQEAPI